MTIPQEYSNLPDRWYAAASEKKLSADDRNELYADTKKCSDYLNSIEVTDEKITSFCHELIKGFDNANKSEPLVKWIAANKNEAYPTFHKLLESISKNTTEKVDPQNIDSRSLQEMNRMLPNIPKDIESVISDYMNTTYDHFNSTDLLQMYQNGAHSEAILQEIIKRVNNNKLDLIELLDLYSLDQLIDFFKADCSKFTYLNLGGIGSLNDEDIEKISKSFSNLQVLSIDRADITNDSAQYFVNMKNLENLYLSNCEHITDFNFLKDLTKLEEVSFKNMGVDPEAINELQAKDIKVTF